MNHGRVYSIWGLDNTGFSPNWVAGRMPTFGDDVRNELLLVISRVPSWSPLPPATVACPAIKMFRKNSVSVRAWSLCAPCTGEPEGEAVRRRGQGADGRCRDRPTGHSQKGAGVGEGAPQSPDAPPRAQTRARGPSAAPGGPSAWGGVCVRGGPRLRPPCPGPGPPSALGPRQAAESARHAHPAGGVAWSPLPLPSAPRDPLRPHPPSLPAGQATALRPREVPEQTEGL